MAETNEELLKRCKDLYRSGVTQALAGFQLLEENLKGYLELYFNVTRKILDGRLHFGFSRQDYQDAAMGRLISVFAKICPNAELIGELRALVKVRDHIAHRALLRLYHGQSITLDEYPELLAEVNGSVQEISRLGEKIVEEMRKVTDALGSA